VRPPGLEPGYGPPEEANKLDTPRTLSYLALVRAADAITAAEQAA
jgi:hypothetical protein